MSTGYAGGYAGGAPLTRRMSTGYAGGNAGCVGCGPTGYPVHGGIRRMSTGYAGYQPHGGACVRPQR
jgi:hypothetical protein